MMRLHDAPLQTPSFYAPALVVRRGGRLEPRGGGGGVSTSTYSSLLLPNVKLVARVPHACCACAASTFYAAIAAVFPSKPLVGAASMVRPLDGLLCSDLSLSLSPSPSSFFANFTCRPCPFRPTPPIPPILNCPPSAPGCQARHGHPVPARV